MVRESEDFCSFGFQLFFKIKVLFDDLGGGLFMIEVKLLRQDHIFELRAPF